MYKKLLILTLTLSTLYADTALAGKDDFLQQPRHTNYAASPSPYTLIPIFSTTYPDGNIVSFYINGTYAIIYTNGIQAFYEPTGSIYCLYPNGETATYDAATSLTTYYSKLNYITLIKSGFPNCIPNHYPYNRPILYNKPIFHQQNENKQNVKPLKKNQNINKIEQKPNNNNNLKKQTFQNKNIQHSISQNFSEPTLNNTPLITQSNTQADIVEKKPLPTSKQTIIIDEPISHNNNLTPILTKYADIVKKEPLPTPKPTTIIDEPISHNNNLTPILTKYADIVKQKNNIIEKEQYNIINYNENIIIKKVKKNDINFMYIDDETKFFLNRIGVDTIQKLKNKINVKNSHYYLTYANKFRHIENENTKNLSKYILKLIISMQDVEEKIKLKAYIYLAKIKSHNNNPQDAIKILEKALNKIGDHPNLYYFVGNNYYYLNNNEEAINNWDKALLLTTENDIEIIIKTKYRFASYEAYNNNDNKKKSQLLFEIIDLIVNKNIISLIENNTEENITINEYKEIFLRSIVYICKLNFNYNELYESVHSLYKDFKKNKFSSKEEETKAFELFKSISDDILRGYKNNIT